MSRLAAVAIGLGCLSLSACQTMQKTSDSVGSTVSSGWHSVSGSVSSGWDSVSDSVASGWHSASGKVLTGWDRLMGTGPVAVAEVKPTDGSTVSGKVQFRQSGDVVHVTINLTGLAPNSKHGFHVHQRGDCSAPDAMSAAGHFNPDDAPHGHYAAGPHHAGDLPNLTADDKGEVHTWFEASYLTVGSGGNDVAGRSIIIHRDPDDFKSQPAGNAGPRLACGVIIES